MFSLSFKQVNWKKYAFYFFISTILLPKLKYNANTKVPKCSFRISYFLNFLNYFYFLMHLILLCKLNVFKKPFWKPVISNTNLCFFISHTFISKARLKLVKNQANANEYPEAELLLFENYSHSSSMWSSKSNRTYSKKILKKSVSVFKRLYDYS